MKDFIKRIISSRPIRYERKPQYGPVYNPEAKKERNKAAVIYAIKQLESSGGKNIANADPGEREWEQGITPIAVEELKRVGLIDDTYDRSNIEDVEDASHKYFNLMGERNPELSQPEIYTEGYWAGYESPEQKRRKESEFQKYVNQFMRQQR